MAVEMEIHQSVLDAAKPKAGTGRPAYQGTPDSPGSIPNVDEPYVPSDSNEDVKLFSPHRIAVTIGSLDMPDLKVSAQYNPRELQVDRMVPWQGRMSPEVDRLTLEYTGDEGRSMSLELLFDGFEENISIRDEIDLLERMSSANIPVDRRQSFVSKYDEEAQTMVFTDTDPGMEDPKLDIPAKRPGESDGEFEKRKGEYIVKNDKLVAKYTQQKALYKQYVESKEAEEKEADKKGLARRPHLCAVTWGTEWLSKPLMCVIDSIRTRYSMFSDEGVPLRATVTLTLKEAHALGIASDQDRLTYQQRLRNQLIDASDRLNSARYQNEVINLDKNFANQPTPATAGGKRP